MELWTPVTAFIKINLGLKVLIKVTSGRTLLMTRGTVDPRYVRAVAPPISVIGRTKFWWDSAPYLHNGSSVHFVLH